MDNTTRQVRLEHWTQIVRSCSNSGLTKREWCEQNQVPIKTYYYWQRLVRRNALSDTSLDSTDTALTEITVPSESDCREGQCSQKHYFHPDVVIRNGSLTIEISNTASKQLLSRLGQVIIHA